MDITEINAAESGTIDFAKQRKYDHLERLGHRNNRGIDIGLVHVFPKLDGTNGAVWADAEGTVYAGSRNRVLSEGSDNAGFRTWLMSEAGESVRALAIAFPHLIFYGEWLVPHTLKTYREGAWRRFYIFDVYDRTTGLYVDFDTYALTFDAFNAEFPDLPIEYIRPLCTINNPTQDQLKQQTETNTYLVAEGAGVGEGIVAKNYAWRQAHRDQVWAKVVRNEFKDKMNKTMGAPHKQGAKREVEFEIADEFITPTLVGKNLAKTLIAVFNTALEAGDEMESRPEHPDFQPFMLGNYRGRIIPQLLERVWYDFITEEMWSALKKHRNATIDFKLMRGQVTQRIKQLAPEVF